LDQASAAERAGGAIDVGGRARRKRRCAEAGNTIPTRFSGSVAESRMVSPERRSFRKDPEHIDGLRNRMLLAGEAIHEPDRLESFPGLHPTQRPQHLAPRHRKRPPDQEIVEDDAPSHEQLLGDGLGQLVGSLRGDYLREQRPPPGRSGRGSPRFPFEAGGPAPLRRAAGTLHAPVQARLEGNFC
jgi:hypothetical protein